MAPMAAFLSVITKVMTLIKLTCKEKRIDLGNLHISNSKAKPFPATMSLKISDTYTLRLPVTLSYQAATCRWFATFTTYALFLSWASNFVNGDSVQFTAVQQADGSVEIESKKAFAAAVGPATAVPSNATTRGRGNRRTPRTATPAPAPTPAPRATRRSARAAATGTARPAPAPTSANSQEQQGPAPEAASMNGGPAARTRSRSGTQTRQETSKGPAHAIPAIASAVAPALTRPRRAPTPAVEENVEAHMSPKTGPAARTRSRSTAQPRQETAAPTVTATAPTAAAPAPTNPICPLQNWIDALADAALTAVAAAYGDNDENEDVNAGAEDIAEIAKILDDMRREASTAISTPEIEAPAPRRAAPARRPYDKNWSKADRALYDHEINVNGKSDVEAAAIVKEARSARQRAAKRAREEKQVQPEQQPQAAAAQSTEAEQGRGKRIRKPSARAQALVEAHQAALPVLDPSLPFTVGVAPALPPKQRRRKRLTQHVVPSSTGCDPAAVLMEVPAPAPAAGNAAADAANAAVFRAAAGGPDKTSKKKTKGASGGVKKPKAKKPKAKKKPAARPRTRCTRTAAARALETAADMDVDTDSNMAMETD